jgi:hypothetical protein
LRSYGDGGVIGEAQAVSTKESDYEVDVTLK